MKLIAVDGVLARFGTAYYELQSRQDLPHHAGETDWRKIFLAYLNFLAAGKYDTSLTIHTSRPGITLRFTYEESALNLTILDATSKPGVWAGKYRILSGESVLIDLLSRKRTVLEDPSAEWALYRLVKHPLVKKLSFTLQSEGKEEIKLLIEELAGKCAFSLAQRVNYTLFGGIEDLTSTDWEEKLKEAYNLGADSSFAFGSIELRDNRHLGLVEAIAALDANKKVLWHNGGIRKASLNPTESAQLEWLYNSPLALKLWGHPVNKLALKDGVKEMLQRHPPT